MKKYKSTILISFIFATLIYTHQGIIGFIVGSVTWQDFLTVLYKFNEPKNVLITLAIISPSVLFFSVMCKAVYLEKDQIRINYIYGLRDKVFKQNSFEFKHVGNATLNEHIVIFDSDKSTIIYPMGTHKFSKLLIELKKMKRKQEPENQANSNHFVVE